MAISPARRIAFEVLLRTETGAAYAADLLHARLGAEVTRQDAALATELTLGTLRWQGLLDALLERHAAKPAARLDAEVRIALRMGLYQLRMLERIPARAAVNESVELVKRARKRSAAALTNAVLHKAADEAKEPAEELLPAGLAGTERLATLHSHPAWLVQRWLERFGREQTISLLRANNRAPATACRIEVPAERAAVERELEQAGIRVSPGRLLADAIVASGGSVARTAAFERGAISIQDEASQAVALVAGARAGESVLDVCAAPGGKTAILARHAGPGGTVVAGELQGHRLRVLAEQMKRIGAPTVRVVGLDGTAALPFSRGFDRILVDAPCSGTGTLARNPEIRWRLREEDFEGLVRRQEKLLRRSAEALAPGGRVVYATCSLEPEENEQIVEAFLGRTRWMRRVPREQLAQELEGHWARGVRSESLLDSEGSFRTFPGEHGSDGFFAAALVRNAE